MMKRPVLILGWIPRIALTVARSLLVRGIDVDLADCVQAPAPRSRFVRAFYRLPYPNESPDGFLNELERVLAIGQHDLLIPTDDVAISAVMEHYDRISDSVQIACPRPEITRKILNKEDSLEAASRCGLRVPRTVTIRNSAELPGLEGQIPMPWILKPAVKEKRFEEFTSLRVNTPEDVRANFPKFREFAPAMLVQEYCEGVGVGVQMLLHKGQPLAIFQHRRLKELPYSGGVAVTAIAETPDARLVGWSLKLLRSLQWEGIAMVEFRMNLASGEAVFLEVNGRYWGSVSLPVALGLDLPYYQWQVLHGEQPEIPKTYQGGTRWRWTAGYFNRFYRLIVLARQSADARAELKRTLAQLPGDFSLSVRDALFHVADPIPAILELVHTASFFSKHAASQLLKRTAAFRKTIPASKATLF
jgi:predicted ATP-grasp superfamily ATP-dependent carboligase